MANMPSPRVPGAAPLGRASRTATSASAWLQNHFWPKSFQRSTPSGPTPMRSASVSSAPTSEPPAFSVMNCVPLSMVAGSWLSSRSSKSFFNASEPKRLMTKFDVSETETGHIRPNSACTKR